MKITNEADYALRIMHYLALCGSKTDENNVVDAKTIAETVSVPPGFTLKILRKLVCGGLVVSYKGVRGGYALSTSPAEITMRSIVELIDGPLTISKCLCDGYECSHSTNRNSQDADVKCGCYFHHVFDEINIFIAKKLENITLDMVIRNDYQI